MPVITIVLIALALAMDAFAVSIANGIAVKRPKPGYALKIGAFFGSFQSVMPVLGWLTGLGLRGLVTGIDHWVAFGLLFAIGCKMIYESLRMGSREKAVGAVSLSVLLLLSVATSVDAFAVGASLSFLKVSIAVPVIVIGIVTFLLSFAGVFIGNLFGHFWEGKIEIVGGLALIGIGIKILLEHLG